MSFGPRNNGSSVTRTVRTQRGTIQPAVVQSSHDDDADSSLQRPLAICGIVFAGFAAVAVVWFALPKRDPSDTMATAPAISSPFAGIRQKLDGGASQRTYDFGMAFPTKNVTPAVAQRNRSLGDGCYSHLTTNRANTTRSSKWNQAFDSDTGAFRFNYDVAGEALNCLLTTEQQRFCEPAERRKIAAAVATYMRQYHKANAVPTNNPMAAQAELFREIARRLKTEDGRTDEDDDKDAKLFFDGIEYVTAAGYFAAADFAGISAPELTPHVLKPLSKPCQ